MDIRGSQGGRGRGIAALIEGGFAVMWFGWAGARAPAWLVPPLIAGAVLAGVIAVLGVLLAWRGHSASSPMADPAVRRRYNLVVLVEFAVIFAGSALLGRLGAEEYVAAWVAAVVGLHFVPLGRAFGEPLLQLSGVLITAVAIAAAVLTALGGGDTSTLAGAGTGLLLLLTAVPTLLGIRILKT